ncbi:MAG: SRPBCC domain-containing protein [Acidobacteriota bacterium]
MKEETMVEAEVEIAARPDSVFSWFSDPERFRRWMGHDSAISPAPGGEIAVGGPGGPPATGRILEWVANERVVFSWTAPGVPEDAGSRVTVLFEAVPGGTRVRLRHEGIPSEKARREHSAGWRALLASLSASVAVDQSSGKLDRIADASLAAWSERDPARRAKLLDESWSDAPSFRDPFASVTGRDALDAHIQTVLAMSPPGARLVRSGPVEQCHGHVRFSWRAEGPDGSAFATGMNFGDLAEDGRLSRVVGFWDTPGNP